MCALLYSGCGKDEGAADEAELVILCGSSFVPPMKQMCEEFTAARSVKTIYTVAGSEDFLPLVKAGQKGDVLITHDPYLDYVKQAGVWASNAQVGFVAPVLAVQKGNPKGLARIEDLTKDDLKVALSNPEYSTCGEMVFALLEKKGIKEAVLRNVGNRLTKGHSALGTFVKTQTVDAVIMWNGVANTFKDSLDIVPTPYEYETEIAVQVIGLNYSQYAEEVKELVEFAKTRGKEIFAENGYVK
jgi:molybdate transport system substrate-binding protein